MGKDPAFLFYPGDWQGGTSTFSKHLKGCYMDILIAQFNGGHLSLEEIKTVLGSDFGSAWPAILKKFKQDENGLFFNEKLEAEMIKRKTYSESRKKNRSSKKATYDTTYVKHMSPHMENENSTIVIVGNSNIDKAQEILNSSMWIEGIAMNESLTFIQVKERLAYFLNKNALVDGYFNKEIKEIKKHFLNWLPTHKPTNGRQKGMVQ